jgi:hypothetical protein
MHVSKKRPDLYPVPKRGISVLCLAVWRGKVAATRLLLEAGAKMEVHMV